MTQPFTAASHHDVLVLLVQLAILLLTARVLGELAQRLGQPTVVGEILAGIVLGPSLLSGLVPALGEWIVPHTEVQGYLLEVVSMIGAMFLLLITGLETDIGLIRRHARTAIGVSLGGIIVTFATGFLLGQLLPDDLLVDNDRRLVFALFVATSMSISAIPVIAKVLMDLNLIRRDIGQTIIAAGMSDDTIGWILLSIVAGLASGEAVTAGTVLQSVGSVLAFMVISFTAGQWVVQRLLSFVQDEMQSRNRILSLMIILMFVWGAITQALNLEAVLGAFVMGILFSQMRSLPQEVIHTLESVALGVFAPIFFAVAGLKVNITNLLEPRLMLIALVVIGVATLGKVVGTYAGARLIGGRDHWTALSFGAGLNARGAMEIIIATVGLSLGILTQDMFSIIVLMAMTTSLMAPTALRWVLRRVTPGEEELQRLRMEELNQASLVPNIHRVLLPLRVREDKQGATQAIEAHILNKLNSSSSDGLAVTLLTVGTPEVRSAASTFLDQISEFFSLGTITKKFISDQKIADAILDEAEKGYDLMVLGTPEGQSTDAVLFNPLLDQIIRHSPCATVLVHGEDVASAWNPHRILVPTNGSLSSRRAAELAYALGNGEEDEVTLLWVVEEQRSEHHLDLSDTAQTRQKAVAQQTLDELREMASFTELKVNTRIEAGKRPEESIVEFAKAQRIDLIILGTNVGIGSEQLYLGPRVESIIRNAPCPVVIINP